MNITGNLVYNQTWFNTLANRLYLKKFSIVLGTERKSTFSQLSKKVPRQRVRT